jgi:hypothetical protein
MGKVIEFHRLPNDTMEQILKEHFGLPIAHIISAKRDPQSWITWLTDKGLMEKIYTALFSLQESGYGDKEYESKFMEILMGRSQYDKTKGQSVWPAPPIFIQKIRIPDSINHEWLQHTNLLRRFRTKEELWEHQGRDAVTGEWIE